MNFEFYSRSQFQFQSNSLAQSLSQAEFAFQFAQVPHLIRKDSSRISLPPVELEKRLIEMEFPFEVEFWILKSSSTGEIKGRISANRSSSYPQIGYIGFFEADDFEASQALMIQAVDWLKKKGVTKVYGPLNLNTWLPYRFKLPSEAGLHFSFEPNQPENYPIWFKQLGFERFVKYHSNGLDGLSGIVDGTLKDYEKAVRLGYSFRNWDHSTLLDKEVPLLHQLSMKSFQNNFLFEPISLEFFKELYVPLVAQKVDLSLAYFVCDSNGKEVGFFFNYIDSEYFILKSAGLISEARGVGLSNAMLHLASKRALSRGVTRSIAALMKNGIQSESYSRKQNLLWENHYVLFEKDLLEY